VGVLIPREASGYYQADDSLRSFLFTLKNPHGVPARKFALRAGEHAAIMCDSRQGPIFGCGCIYVSDNCNANRDNRTAFFGIQYDSEEKGKDFLTGADHFTVKKIEVFQIAD
jgi:hypothetical protein